MTLIDKISTGLKICNPREDKSLTQAQLAEMIDMTDSTMSKIEVGRVYSEFSTIKNDSTHSRIHRVLYRR